MNLDRFVIRLIKFILWFRYRISINGLDEIKESDEPILFIANHPSLSDPLIVIKTLWPRFKPRALVRDLQIQRPIIGHFVQSFNPISVPDMRKINRKKARWAQESVTLASEAIKNGDNVLLWPAGKLSRDGYDYFLNKSTTYKIFNAHPHTRLVALRSQGLWGSRTGWYGGPDTPIWKVALLGVIFIPLNLFFVMPKRRIVYDVKEIHNLKGLDKTKFNIKLQTYLNQLPQIPQITPLMCWHKVTFKSAGKPQSIDEILEKEN